jgi:hypothetical protein
MQVVTVVQNRGTSGAPETRLKACAAGVPTFCAPPASVPSLAIGEKVLVRTTLTDVIVVPVVPAPVPTFDEDETAVFQDGALYFSVHVCD